MEPTPPRHVRRAARPTSGDLYRRERAAGRAWDFSTARPTNVTPHVDEPTIRFHPPHHTFADAPTTRLPRTRAALPDLSAGRTGSQRRAVSTRSRPPATTPGTSRHSPGRRRLIAVARTASTVATASLLVLTAFAWNATNKLSQTVTSSNALAHAPRSAGAAENILLMGLDSRKDQSGNDLPASILQQLHAGDSSDGGYNTNTLILIHIPADRKNVVAFSIPRDDYVEMHDLDVSDAKIKEAYGRTKAKVEQRMIDNGQTDQQTLETQGREAGRAAAIRVVRDLTGVPIDRFAEVSLVGFYDVASALGGVTVCLNHRVHDSYSGASFPAGRQQLSASQALAFVRQRHGLDNGDLDRTRRQQAFLISALHQLQNAGTLADPAKLQALTDVLHRDVVVSDGWNLLQWAQEMTTPAGQQIHFSTLPVERYATVEGQSVNIVDSDAIRAQVQRAFGVPLTPATTATSTADTATPDSSSAQAQATTTQSAASTTPAVPNVDQGTAVSADAAVPCVD